MVALVVALRWRQGWGGAAVAVNTRCLAWVFGWVDVWVDAWVVAWVFSWVDA